MTQQPTAATLTPEDLALALNAALSINHVTLEEATHLITAGMNINHPDPRPQFAQQTPLCVAVIHDAKPDVISLLIDHGADPNAKDELGGTPLMLAAMTAHNHEVLVLLLEAGADPDQADGVGWTALMYAAEKPDNSEMVITLLGAGANHAVRSPAGETALSIAAKRSTPDVVRALLDAGAKPGPVDHYGNTVLDYALNNHQLAGSPELHSLKTAAHIGRGRPS